MEDSAQSTPGLLGLTVPPATTMETSDIYRLTITFFSLLYTHNPSSFLASCSELTTICDYVTHSGKGNMIVVVAYMATMSSEEMARRLAEREHVLPEQIVVYQSIVYSSFFRVRDYVL